MDGLTGDPDYSLSRVHAGTPIHYTATAQFTARSVQELVTRRAIATWPFQKSEPRKSGSHETRRWREMDSNFRYRGAKAADFRSIPGIAGVSAGLLNDTT
jgi:hypothetical protein